MPKEKRIFNSKSASDGHRPPLQAECGRSNHLSLLRLLYSLIYPIAFVLLLPRYLRRMMRRGNYRPGFAQRFGRYSPALRTRLAEGPPRAWIQAVSVGEMLVALKLIAALQTRRPDARFILSTTTTTGFALAIERAGAGVEVIYTPIDAAFCVRRAFDVLRPASVIIADGGIWPNLLWEAKDRGLHVSLVNARLSPRSERRWRQFSFLARPVMHLLDLVCVPVPEDVTRWRGLGISAERIQVTGSVKFDDQPPASPADTSASTPADFLRKIHVPETAPVLLAGSTHPGEEHALCEAYLRLLTRSPGLLLIVAPRHVERAREILAELSVLGLRIVSRSSGLAPGFVPPPLRPDLLLLDTTGELRDWYSVATLVFIGKSLTARGGQNPMEAIAAGKPVIFGPHMDNFRDLAAQLLAARGRRRGRRRRSLGKRVRASPRQPGRRGSPGHRGARSPRAAHGSRVENGGSAPAARRISVRIVGRPSRLPGTAPCLGNRDGRPTTGEDGQPG